MKNNRFVACVLIPSVIFLLIFAVFPVAYGLGISFYDYNPTSSYNEFLGLENYKRLLTDEVFWIAVKKYDHFLCSGSYSEYCDHIIPCQNYFCSAIQRNENILPYNTLYSVYCADCRNIYGVEIWNGRNRWRIIEPYFGTYGDAA